MDISVKVSAQTNVKASWRWVTSNKTGIYSNGGVVTPENSDGMTVSHVTGHVMAIVDALQGLDRKYQNHPNAVQGTIRVHAAYQQLGGILNGTARCTAPATQRLMEFVKKFRARYPLIAITFDTEIPAAQDKAFKDIVSVKGGEL